MNKTLIKWLLTIVVSSLCLSCQKEAAQRAKTPEELARENAIDELVADGVEVVAAFGQMEEIFSGIRDARTLRKAERDLNALKKKLKGITRSIRLKEIPTPEMRGEINKKLERDFEELRHCVLSSMKRAEGVPPDLFVAANEALNNFLNGDHGLGAVMNDYFSPVYRGEPAPNPEFTAGVQASRERVIEANRASSSSLNELTATNSDNIDDLPVLPETAEPEEGSAKAIIVEDE